MSAHFLPMHPAGFPAALPLELLLVPCTTTLHPAVAGAPAAHPVRLAIEPTGSLRGVGVHRLGPQLNAVPAAPHSDRLLLDRAAGLHVLIQCVDHHLPGVRVAH